MQDVRHQPELAQLNDRDLLRRFVQDADEAAFAEIVQRHQALVMGVCRRVIGDSPEVEDAFQATFVTLARRPGRIRKARSLSSWLYSVAWRTSVRLVRQRRRQPVEALSNEPVDRREPGPLALIEQAQQQIVLDEELNQLPERFRDVLVMNYFAGHSSQQIADQLNVSKGTVDGRLRQARNMLRVRLARRGVAIGVLTAAASLSSNVATAATPDLISTTIQLGTKALSGSVSGPTAPTHLEPLIRPEMAMISTKQILAGILCVSAVAAGIAANGNASGQTNNEDPFGGTTIDAVIETNDSGETEDPFGDGGSSDQPANEVVNVSVNVATPQPMQAMGLAGGIGDGPKFTSYPSDAKPVERWMYDLLDKPLTQIQLEGEIPLSIALSFIEERLTEAYGNGAGANGENFRLVVWPDKLALSDEGLDSLDDVSVTLNNLEGVSLKSALNLIFKQASQYADLTYMIQDEVLLVTTRSYADEMMTIRVYDVDHLIDLDYGAEGIVSSTPSGGGAGFFSVSPDEPGTDVNAGADNQNRQGRRRQRKKNRDGKNANRSDTDPYSQVVTQFGGEGGGMGMGGGSGGGGLGRAHPQEPVTLATVVMDLTSSPDCQWLELDGLGGVARIVGRSLVVRQTHRGHQEIVRFLNLLTETIARTDGMEMTAE